MDHVRRPKMWWISNTVAKWLPPKPRNPQTNRAISLLLVCWYPFSLLSGHFFVYVLTLCFPHSASVYKKCWLHSLHRWDVFTVHSSIYQPTNFMNPPNIEGTWGWIKTSSNILAGLTPFSSYFKGSFSCSAGYQSSDPWSTYWFSIVVWVKESSNKAPLPAGHSGRNRRSGQSSLLCHLAISILELRMLKMTKWHQFYSIYMYHDVSIYIYTYILDCLDFYIAALFRSSKPIFEFFFV